jgi:hypothetical protein
MKIKLKTWHYALIGAIIGGLLGWWNPCNVNPHKEKTHLQLINSSLN